MIASFILLLHLWGVIPAESAMSFLYLTGVLLILAEIFVTSFGVVALNGIIALFIAYSLQTGNNTVLGLEVDWPFLFGVASIEFLLILITGGIYLHYRKKKVTTGTESMVGADAQVVSWSGKKGIVRIQGESWKALSDTDLNLNADDKVRVQSIDGLVLTVTIA